MGEPVISKFVRKEEFEEMAAACLEKQCRIVELQAQLAELQKPCVWTYDEIHDKWDTACGNAFQFMDSGPNDNECKFCCYCGHPIKEHGP